MYFKKIAVLSFIILFSLISGCKRNLEPISTFETEKKAHEDIAKIEKIKKDNKSWEENLDIDLYTAIALAIKNNKELKIKLLETAMANRQLDKVRFEMLPSFAANAGYSGSEKYNATASATVPTTDLAGSIGSSYSTSRERDVNSQDIGFTWNALDFGLSYIRAGQDSNRYLISDEMERKAEHNITSDVIRAYWNTLSADKLIKKYDPLLIEVDKALNDSQKIEELLLTKPMDALLYQKELLDIQRALQTQKEMFIDSRIQLATLMGLLPNQKFKVVETESPLTILDMSIKGMEEYALIHRPELKKSHYDEAISMQETKAGMASLLPGLNFNAAWTHSSNDHLMNKTNLEYGSVMGANLLNVFMYPKIKKINQTNTEIIKEKRLALSMAVLSQVHLANIDYSLALEEYDTAERYYEVSRKITEQIKNAQKIAKFGKLELIREQASLLVAELRHDLAYTKLQYAVGKIYTSVGIDISRENIKDLSFKDYASLIKKNFNASGKKYYAKLRKPIKNQNPVVKHYGDESVSQFAFDRKTFELQGEGRINLNATLKNGDPLPLWLSFLPSQRTFLVNNNEKDNTEEIEITLTAKNINTKIEDTFTLIVEDPVLKAKKLEKEKLEKERLLAEKRKEEELIKLEQEKLLQTQKEKEEKELLVKKQAEEEERLKLEQEKLLQAQKEKEEKELLVKKQAEEEEKLKLEQEKLLQAQKEKEEKELLVKKQAEEEEIKLLAEKRKKAKLKIENDAKQLTKNRVERFKLLANLEDTDFNALDDINKQSEDIKLLKENIDEMFIKLDLDSRAKLFQSIIKDLAEKTNNINYSNSGEGRKSVSFLSPDYDNENQRIILEKLSNYADSVKN